MANVSTPGGFSTPYNTVAGSVSPTKAHGAEFFAVASGVQIPYVGRDETGLNTSRISTPPYLPDEYPSRLAYSSLAPLAPPFGITQRHKVSTKDEGSFAKLADVFTQYHPVTDKSSKDISRSYLKKISSGLAFNEDVLQDRAPHTLPYNEDELNSVFRTGGLGHHAKGHMVGPVGRHDTRGVVKRHALCHLKGPRKLKPLRRSKTTPAFTNTEKLIRTTTKLKAARSSTENALSQESSKYEWDEFVLACLSKSTAQWIISEQSSGTDKERLTSFYEKRIQETEEKPASKELSVAAAAEGKRASSKKKSKELKEKKSQQALEIHYTPSFTLSSAVGSKKLETDNIFQQELLGGAQPVSSKKTSDSSFIVLDTNDKLKFQKQLQENYPQDSKVWYSSKGPSGKVKEKPQKKPKKPVKGLQRWKELPVVVQDDNYVPVMKESNIDVKALSNAYKEKKKMRDDSNVVKIVEEWRSKWFLERRWQKCGTDELIKAMSDINDHVRLAAVSACSKAAELRQMKKEEHHLGIMLDKTKGPTPPLEAVLEPELIEAISKLLDDRNSQVKVAAAITLYSLNRPSDKAKSVLLWAMEHGGPPEKWAATQCLALSGVITDKVIVELVNHLHADNAVRTEKAGTLLAKLSQQSDVVQSLIAELLNSNSWKDRVTACKVIPKLKGGANKDMTHKLSYLMWNDWSKDVRSAAAQALGRTGNGKLVHDALRERILTGNERIKVDALKKLSNLGIMTARLLPALQECFKSEYVSVRIEAAMVAGKLKITDKGVLTSLLRLASDDNSWKVKAHTIKALGSIGVVDEKLIEVLLWSIRYEKVAAVRAEACNAIAVLGLRDERLLSVLQDRLVVETEELVKREAIITLESLGVEPTGDLEMVEAIRQEVRRLCRKDAIVSHILEEDQAAEYTSDYKRMFTTETEQGPPSRVASRATKAGSRAVSRATSESSRGWDPILAGYHARERMSRAPTPGDLVMRRSYLPMDLNSTSSEGSGDMNMEKWDDLSEHSEDEEEPGSEVDHNEAQEENIDQIQEVVQIEKRSESAEGNTSLAGLNSPSKVEFSEDRGVASTLTSDQPEETGDQDPETFFEFESNKDEPELLQLADGISEFNVTSPTASGYEQSEGNDLGSSVA
ncbi:hypothetical protein ACROYT_G005843 [Oculina patagonica]